MQDTVIILGAGNPNGVGGAIAQRFGREDLHIVVSGRTISKLETTAQSVIDNGGSAEPFVADVTSPEALAELFGKVRANNQRVAAVIFNAGNNAPITFAELTPETFEAYWRVGCYGGFLAAKEAIPILAAQESGSFLITGASASLRGRPNFGHFASSKAGLRNLAQALAREYGPQGVHVAHIVIDGAVNGGIVQSRFGDYLDKLGPDGALEPSAIAETFWQIHQQPRSAWSHEIDLRPFKESW
ncbi:MAG: SDR family NAD(P)-dependent oxidoreductase [Pseudomonadota bacterium]